MTDKVPNPYRAAIVGAKSRSAGPADTLRTAFTKASTAMESGAWIGGKADDFGSSLSHWKQTASSAATSAMGEFDDAISGQPELVDVNSWQVHWHNLGR